MNIEIIESTDDPFRPKKPDGYTEGGMNGGRWDCDLCGARVDRTDLHDRFHEGLYEPPYPDDYDNDEDRHGR
ncbi:hypothetical protein FDO65_07045 [Nakamurella flava]|uniref:Uncharacterized protein n=1 Tax=Nakamurella flava TaxID=2576308 RepID=A0A4U6QLB0_9ACTN|nr:hypothetical protein [Nakamurella flava]TKV61347.1 hypothetical protein FDO65_07045 [Nakamurella flava]